MTQDELMFIAREAGFGEPINHNDWHLPFKAVKVFAEMVAEAQRKKSANLVLELDLCGQEMKAANVICAGRHI